MPTTSLLNGGLFSRELAVVDFERWPERGKLRQKTKDARGPGGRGLVAAQVYHRRILRATVSSKAQELSGSGHSPSSLCGIDIASSTCYQYASAATAPVKLVIH